MVLLVSIATLLAGLAVAGGAAAQEITDIQSYTWSNTSSDDLGQHQEWHPVDSSNSDSGMFEVPADGLALVNVNYNVDGPGEIVFRYVLDSEFGEPDSEQLEYTFNINAAGNGHVDVSPENQNVFLAGDVDTGDSSDPNENGCGGTSTPTLTGNVNCWFLIELPNEDNGNSFGSLGSAYTLEVEVGDAEKPETQDSNPDTHRTVIPVDRDIALDSMSFDPVVSEINDSTIEAGIDTTVNVTIETGLSSNTNRNTGNSGLGDVDAWICLFETGEDETPYDNYGALVGADASPHQWDEPATCRFMDFPTDHGDGDDLHAKSLGSSERNPGPRDNEFHHFEHTFTIGREEVEVTPTEFVDTFDVRIVARDAMGNILIEEGDNSNNPAPITVAHFESNQTPTDLGVTADNSTITVSDFIENDGCLQPGKGQDSNNEDIGKNRSHNNTVDNPCYRSLDHAPPDQAFEFPVRVENYANVEDEIELSWSQRDGENWDVRFFQNGNDAGETVTVTVGPGDPDGERTGDDTSPWTSVTERAFETVTVRVTPDAQSTAEAQDAGDDDISSGFSTIRTRSQGQYSDLPLGNAPVRENWFLQARLVQNAQGTIGFGTEASTSLTVTGKAQQEKTVDLTVENTGNTDGPFEVIVDSGDTDTDSECGAVNGAEQEGQINFELTDEVGDTVDSPETIFPGDTEDYKLKYEVGNLVQTGTYDCVFSFEPNAGTRTSADDDIELDPSISEPTLTIDVQGTPDIRIWDTQGPEREQVKVTDDEVHLTVPPGDGSGHQDVFFFLENVGDVGLEPELQADGNGWPVTDAHGLDRFSGLGDGVGWEGLEVDDSGGLSTISLDEAESSFSLPISDTNETEHVLVSDLFPNGDDGPVKSGASASGGDPHWDCAGEDGEADSTEERILCRVAFRYNFEGAVTGDHVAYNFTWEDPQQSEQTSHVVVHLHFEYPGEVETTDMGRSVIGTGDTSSLTFEAELEDGHRFDLTTSSDVEADVNVGYNSGGSSQTCTVQDGEDSTLTSDQEADQSATFNPDVEASFDTQGCTFKVTSGGTIDIDAPEAGTAEITLDVEDENGTSLRQVRPASIEVLNQGSVNKPSGVGDEVLLPSTTLQATGKQYVDYRYDHPADGFPERPQDGLVVYRTDDTDALQPYSTLDLQGEATAVGGELTDATRDRTWTQLEASGGPVPAYNGDDRLNASLPEVSGILMQENNDQQPERIGDVTLTGWGDGSIEWTEGWNPLVLRVVDEDGDELEDGLDENDFQLELKLVVRDSNDVVQHDDHTHDDPDDGHDGNITDLYELSTQQDTLHVRYLDGGYLAADVYLPDGLTDNDLDSGLELADHPMEDSTGVEMEAWALHLEVENGDSTDGDPLDGDAYWRADDIGLVDGDLLTNATQNGTGGASSIREVSGQAFQSEDLTDDSTQDDQERLHVATKFVNGPVYPDGDWITGPGIHDYEVFLLEETDDHQEDPRTVDDQDTAPESREHTFQPHSDKTPTFEVTPAARETAPGAEDEIELEENGTVPGLFSTFFGLPDQGHDFDWISQLTIHDGDTELVSTNAKVIEQKEDRQALSQGIPMPLALDQDALVDVEDQLSSPRNITDTRAIPGFVPDRGHFGIAASVTNDDGGFLLDLNDAGDTIFEVEGEGLLTIPSDNLPTTGEVDRPIKLTGDRAISPTPASAVASVEAELILDGVTQDSTQLTDSGSNEWTGSVTPTQQGDHRLVIRATDTAGGVSTVGSTVNVSADAPPEITIDAPSETEDVRAMTSDGTIQATVLDSSIVASDVTYEEKIGSDGDGPSVLTAENASFDSLRDTEENDSSPFSVTLTLNQTEGNAWLNVTDVDGSEPSDAFNSTIDATSFSDGEVSGTLWMNETGTVTLTVQTNGTVDETFTVDVVENIGSGFTEVSLGNDLTCEAAECSISYSPDGLSDGDTYQFEITADVAGQSESSGPHEVVVDDQSPSVDLSIGSPSVSGTPTIVGPSTSVTVTATDNVPGDVDGGVVDQLAVSGVRAGTTTGSTDVSAGDTVDMDQLGLGSEGSGTIQANVTDLAGNQDTASVDVQVDASGPSISNADLSTSAGDLVVQATVTDDAGIDRVRLFHKGPSATTFSSMQMSAAGDDTFEASVSDPGSAGLFEYYITARDRFDNEDRLRSQNNPFTQDLGEIDFENSAPEVTIVAPSDGETVSGAINVTIEASDPDEDSLEIPDLQATVTDDGSTTSIPFDGSLTDGAATVSLDTSQFPDGRVELEASVTDGLESASDTVTVIVENRPTPTSCPDADGELTAGDSVDVCFTYGTPANVTELNVALVRNGETVDEVTLDPREDGAYRATFEIPEEGTYVLQITATTEDGGTQELTTDTFSVGVPAGPGDQPLGRFVTTLVLGVAVVGLSAFAAFGRWG